MRCVLHRNGGKYRDQANNSISSSASDMCLLRIVIYIVVFIVWVQFWKHSEETSPPFSILSSDKGRLKDNSNKYGYITAAGSKRFAGRFFCHLCTDSSSSGLFAILNISLVQNLETLSKEFTHPKLLLKKSFQNIM